jgi:hypothetical protein
MLQSCGAGADMGSEVPRDYEFHLGFKLVTARPIAGRCSRKAPPKCCDQRPAAGGRFTRSATPFPDPRSAPRCGPKNPITAEKTRRFNRRVFSVRAALRADGADARDLLPAILGRWDHLPTIIVVRHPGYAKASSPVERSIHWEHSAKPVRGTHSRCASRQRRLWPR